MRLFRANLVCRVARSVVVLLGLVSLASAATGCAALGAVAYATSSTVKVKPYYTGLKGQSVGVIVSADQALRIDHPALQLDIARGTWGKLQKTQENKAEELAGTTFPPGARPEAIYTFQQNHPGLTESMIELAPRFGVTRLIHIEVADFQLHPEQVPDLDRGYLSARVQVIEVDGGKGKVGFDERIKVVFPETAPEEGVPGYGEAGTRRGVLDAFTTSVIQKFVTYEAPR